jgi:hypothetical protein
MDPSYTTTKELFVQAQELIKLYIPVIKFLERSIQDEDLIYQEKSAE